MRILSGVLIAIGVVVIGMMGFIYSGIYNVAASKPHAAVVAWILGETMENSVRVRASSIKTPPGFDSINTERVYFVYHSICAICHGGSSAVARGLNPYAPNLVEAAKELSPASIFWIVKHGVKMTGMPAFGNTYNDDEIWTLTATVKKLSTIRQPENPKKEKGEP